MSQVGNLVAIMDQTKNFVLDEHFIFQRKPTTKPKHDYEHLN